jgi:hypothetical protein
MNLPAGLADAKKKTVKTAGQTQQRRPAVKGVLAINGDEREVATRTGNRHDARGARRAVVRRAGRTRLYGR